MKKIFTICFLCLIIVMLSGCFNWSDGSTTIDSSKESVFNITDETNKIGSTSNQTTDQGGDKTISNNCSLIVSGQELSAQNYVFLDYDNCRAELPVIAILKALGARVEHLNEENLAIIYNGKSYILNTVQYTLIEENNTEVDWFAEPPGSMSSIYKIIGTEVVIDSDVMRYFLQYEMGCSIKINYEEATIYIEPIEE